MRVVSRTERRQRKHERVRKRVKGSSARPRLNVFRSSKHIYAQIVDDDLGQTLATASTLSKELKAQLKSGANKAAAKAVGQLIAQKAKQKNISQVVFDRGGYLYHGRISELANGAREGGLKF
jgi:large subunit ribosomal protein L18